MVIDIWVPGKAEPGGSKNSYYIKGRSVVVDANRNVYQWKQHVALCARQVYKDLPLIRPLQVCAYFFQVRPKSHYGTGKNAHLLKKSAPRYPITKPDLTKFWRSTEDALTGIIWKDDAIICQQTINKTYGDESGVRICVRIIDD